MPMNPDLGWFALSRTFIGQITGVNEAAGTIDVVIDPGGLGIKREGLEIPWGGFSQNGHRSSWMRYMPQLRAKSGDDDTPGGDLVYVAFGPMGECYVLGFASAPGGYAGFTTAKTTNGSRMPKGDWGDFRMGEFDFRSMGGAYVYGDRYGSLLLSAGPTVQLRLDKKNNEARNEAGLWKFGAAGSFIKFGDVKRSLPLAFKETDFSILDPTATKEFNVHLVNALTGLSIADYEFGAVRDEFGVPVIGTTGVPGLLRSRIRLYGIDGLLTSYTNEIDVNGNQRVAYGASATAVDVTAAPTTQLSLSFGAVAVDTVTSLALNATTDATLHGELSATLSSSGSTSVTGANVAVTGTGALVMDAPLVQMGLNATEPAAKGPAVLAALSALLVLATSMAAAESPPLGNPGAFAAWGVMVTTLTALLAVPPGPGAIMATKAMVE